MSLNKFAIDTRKGHDINLKIGCDEFECNIMKVDEINITNGGNVDSHNLTVNNEFKSEGITNLNGNIFPNDLGQNNYSLHTDGNGVLSWLPDAVGTGDISYNGVPPTVVGQFAKFSSTDGTIINQSVVVENGSNLDLGTLPITNAGTYNGVDLSTLGSSVSTNSMNITNLQNETVRKDGTIAMTGNLDIGGFNITNINLVDGEDLPAFKTDYDNKVNQDVRTNSSPTFGQPITTSLKTNTINENTIGNGVNIETVLIKDGLVDGVDISALNTTVGTNTTNITDNSNDKLDKDGMTNLRIANTTAEVILKDTVSIGASNGKFTLHDSVDTEIACLCAVSGNIELARQGVKKLELQDTKNISYVDLDLNGNSLVNLDDLKVDSFGVGVLQSDASGNISSETINSGFNKPFGNSAGTVAEGDIRLIDLGDANIPTPIENDIIVRNGAFKWVNTPHTVTNITDINLTNVQDNDILTYDLASAEWINEAPSAGVSTLVDLTDTTITAPTDGQIIKYDNGTSKWINANNDNSVLDGVDNMYIGTLADRVPASNPTILSWKDYGFGVYDGEVDFVSPQVFNLLSTPSRRYVFTEEYLVPSMLTIGSHFEIDFEVSNKVSVNTFIGLSSAPSLGTNFERVNSINNPSPQYPSRNIGDYSWADSGSYERDGVVQGTSSAWSGGAVTYCRVRIKRFFENAYTVTAYAGSSPTYPSRGGITLLSRDYDRPIYFTCGDRASNPSTYTATITAFTVSGSLNYTVPLPLGDYWNIERHDFSKSLLIKDTDERRIMEVDTLGNIKFQDGVVINQDGVLDIYNIAVNGIEFFNQTDNINDHNQTLVYNGITNKVEYNNFTRNQINEKVYKNNADVINFKPTFRRHFTNLTWRDSGTTSVTLIDEITADFSLSTLKRAVIGNEGIYLSDMIDGGYIEVYLSVRNYVDANLGFGISFNQSTPLITTVMINPGNYSFLSGGGVFKNGISQAGHSSNFGLVDDKKIRMRITRNSAVQGKIEMWFKDGINPEEKLNKTINIDVVSHQTDPFFIIAGDTTTNDSQQCIRLSGFISEGWTQSGNETYKYSLGVDSDDFVVKDTNNNDIIRIDNSTNSVNIPGKLKLGGSGTIYEFPIFRGNDGDILVSNGSGVLTFQAPIAGPTIGNGVGEIQSNGAILGNSQILETDGSSNIISVAKQTGYNKSFGTSAGTVLEGDTVIINDLEGLTDTNFTSKAEGDIMTYDNGTSTWINTQPLKNLFELDDTNLVSVSNNDLLSFDTNTSKWINKAPSSFVLAYGGKANNVRFFLVHGDPMANAESIQTYLTDYVIPTDCNLSCMTCNTQSGNATTQYNIYKNGVAQTPFTCSGGVGFGAINVDFVAGDTCALFYTNVGQDPDEANFLLFFQ